MVRRLPRVGYLLLPVKREVPPLVGRLKFVLVVQERGMMERSSTSLIYQAPAKKLFLRMEKFG
jgi:hypothetical protein